jgi:succinate dehydrogenase/fumarate reductase cytochrome b subunit
MNVPLVTALVALAPVCMLFFGSAAMFFREKRAPSFLQLIGAGCLMVVVLAHICEALHLFPWMKWGDEHSVGHYLDFGSAIFGLTLFPLGYLLHVLTKADVR